MNRALSLLFPSLLLVACAPDRAPRLDGTLAGIAQDEADRPIAGADIEVRVGWDAIATNEFWRQAPTPSRILYRGKSGNDGRFTIEVRRGPLYAVSFKKGGYKTARVVVYTNRPFAARMVAGKDVGEAEATPDASRGLTGVLTDKASGKPITNAILRQPWEQRAIARPDATGRYTLPWTEKLAQDIVVIVAPGYRIKTIPKESFVAGRIATANVALERGVAVTGQILDAAGRPVAGQRVLIDSDILVTPTHSYGGIAWTTETDANGRFRFAELAPGGRYWVRTLLDDGTPLEIAQGIAGETAIDAGTVRTGPRMTVHGQVSWLPKTLIRDREGKQIEKNGPVTAGRVHVLRLFDGKIAQWLVARETPHWPIDASGFYRIPGLCPGRYELGFYADGAGMEVRVVDVPEGGAPPRELSVALGSGRRFTGKVTDQAGKPIGGALVRALPVSEHGLAPLVPPENPTAHNGRFLVGNVRVLTRPNGAYLLERVRTRVPIRLLIAKEGYSARKIRLEPGEKPPAVIVLGK